MSLELSSLSMKNWYACFIDAYMWSSFAFSFWRCSSPVAWMNYVAANWKTHIHHSREPLDRRDNRRKIERRVNAAHRALFELRRISTMSSPNTPRYPSICIMRGKSSLILFSIRMLGSMRRRRNFTIDSKS